jgi:L-asparaginase II
MHITTAIGRLASEPVAHVGVDGCGAPAHALTLAGLARAYAAIAVSAEDTPAGRVAAAMRAHPDLVGGSGREVTALIAGVPGLVAKDGAEGVFAGAVDDGRAVALKLSDGAQRGRAAVLVAALDRLGVDTSGVADVGTTAVLGGGVPVGEVRATLPR